MALHTQVSFSTGELDPALHERTNLQKYQSALKRGRNSIIMKTGGATSRMGRFLFAKAKNNGEKIKIFSFKFDADLYCLEIGIGYLRLYHYQTISYLETTDSPVDSITEEDLELLSVVVSEGVFHVLRKDKEIFTVVFLNETLIVRKADEVFDAPPAPEDPPGSYAVQNVNSGGYPVIYAVTLVIEDEEGKVVILTVDANPPGTNPLLLPVAAGDSNTINAEVPENLLPLFREARFYRAPAAGGQPGFIGSSRHVTEASPGYFLVSFWDYGQAADYTNTYPFPLPGVNPTDGGFASGLNPYAGVLYQQRFVFSYLNEIFLSRPVYEWNFWRDFPLDSDSAFVQRLKSKGVSRILHMIDSEGLVLFTDGGVFLHTGIVSPTNLFFDKKGSWVSDEKVPPVAIPGGVFFIDKSTNVVRQLTWSEENGTYLAEEISIFSNHLFKRHRVVSWSFMSGEYPILWTIRDDNKFLSFTYEREHQMRAWMRHDSDLPVEQVACAEGSEIAFFVVNHNGQRYISHTANHLTEFLQTKKVEDWLGPQKHMVFDHPMDEVAVYAELLNLELEEGDDLIVTPVTPDDWGGVLNIESETDDLFDNSVVLGDVLRMFFEDDTHIDLEVVELTDSENIKVQPMDGKIFPEEYATNPRLFITKNEIANAGKLFDQDEGIGIVVDGEVIASPKNDVENYPLVTRTGDNVILPNNKRGAIILIGRTFVSDLETLDIDSVEQRPVLIESKTSDKVYIKVNESRGLYVGNKFPKDDGVQGMQSLDQYDFSYDEEDDEYPIVAGRPRPPASRRYEITLPGDWESQGRICLRNVDPVKFEITSIIADLEDLRR